MMPFFLSPGFFVVDTSALVGRKEVRLFVTAGDNYYLHDTELDEVLALNRASVLMEWKSANPMNAFCNTV